MKKGSLTFQGTRGGTDAHESTLSLVGEGIDFAKLAHFQNQLRLYLNCIIRKVTYTESYEVNASDPVVDANVDRGAFCNFRALQDGKTHKYRLPAPKAAIVSQTSAGDRVGFLSLGQIATAFTAAVGQDMHRIDGWIHQRK
jgi:hypothetical protein